MTNVEILDELEKKLKSLLPGIYHSGVEEMIKEAKEKVEDK